MCWKWIFLISMRCMPRSNPTSRRRPTKRQCGFLFGGKEAEAASKGRSARSDQVSQSVAVEHEKEGLQRLLEHGLQLANAGNGATAASEHSAIAMSSSVWRTTSPKPMLPLELWRNRVIVVGSLGNFTAGAVMMGVAGFLPTYIQGTMGAALSLAVWSWVRCRSPGPWPASSQPGSWYERAAVSE